MELRGNPRPHARVMRKQWQHNIGMGCRREVYVRCLDVNVSEAN